MPEPRHKLQELTDERAKFIHDARELLKGAEEEGRSLNEEEDAKWSKLLDEADKKRKEIQVLERQIKAEESLEDEASRGLGTRSEPDPPTFVQEGDEGEEKRVTNPLQSEEYRTAFNKWLAGRLRTHEVRDEFWGQMPVEIRALQSDDDEQAGYLVPPEQFVTELIRDLDDTVYIRSWSRTFTVRRAQSLGAPKRSARLSTFGWSQEIVAPTADTALKFAKRNLSPHYLSGSILVSRDLLRNAVVSVDGIVREEMARDAGEVQEDAFLTGSGAQQPLGIFTASSEGISTSRDVSTGNTTTEVKFDGLIEAKWSIKAGYWPRLRGLFHRDIAKQIAKEKDGDGNYLWRESVRAGEPDRLLNIPVFISERAPNTATTGQYVGIFGDFSRYWIADALDMEMMRLDELNARTNQVEFIARLKTDAMPQVEEAFARIKLA